jgi:hypothetical protein
LPDKEKVFMPHLARLGIRRLEEITVRRIGSKRVIEPLFSPLAPPVNSDFRPFVQIEAPRTRFERRTASAILALSNAPLPILEMVGGAPIAYLREPAAEFEFALSVRAQSLALRLARTLIDPKADPLAASDDDGVRLALLTLKQQGALCTKAPLRTVVERLQWAAEMTLVHLAPPLRRKLWIEGRWMGCTPAQMSPPMRNRFRIYAAIAARDSRAMLERARAQLEAPPEGGDDWGRFLLLTAMLGGHVSGQHEEAQRLWSAHRGALYPGGAAPQHVTYIANLDAAARAAAP